MVNGEWVGGYKLIFLWLATSQLPNFATSLLFNHFSFSHNPALRVHAPKFIDNE